MIPKHARMKTHSCCHFSIIMLFHRHCALMWMERDHRSSCHKFFCEMQAHFHIRFSSQRRSSVHICHFPVTLCLEQALFPKMLFEIHCRTIWGAIARPPWSPPSAQQQTTTKRPSPRWDMQIGPKGSLTMPSWMRIPTQRSSGNCGRRWRSWGSSSRRLRYGEPGAPCDPGSLAPGVWGSKMSSLAAQLT